MKLELSCKLLSSCVCCGHGSGFFRVFGYGLAWKDTNVHPLLFSERLRVTKFLRIGRYIIKPLTRDQLNIVK